MNFTNVRWLYDKTNYGERVVNTLSGLDQGCLRVRTGMFSLSTKVFRGVQYLLSHFEAPPNYTIVRSNQLCEWRMFLPLVYSWFEVDRSLDSRCVYHSRTSPFRLALFMWQLAHLSRWSRGPIESFQSRADWLITGNYWCRDLIESSTFDRDRSAFVQTFEATREYSAVEEKCPN